MKFWSKNRQIFLRIIIFMKLETACLRNDWLTRPFSSHHQHAHNEVGAFWRNWKMWQTYFRKRIFRNGLAGFAINNYLLTKLERRTFRGTTVSSIYCTCIPPATSRGLCHCKRLSAHNYFYPRYSGTWLSGSPELGSHFHIAAWGSPKIPTIHVH